MIYLELFLTFLKIGTFTFGGGHAMIPLIQQEVLKNSWMTLEELINFIGISESTPGPFAVNIASFVGYRLAGVWGALVATIGVILTSFILILVIARVLEKYKDNKVVKYCMEGMQPVIVGLILSAIITMSISVFFPNGIILNTLATIDFWKSIVIFVVAMFMLIKKVHPIKTILASGVLGIILGWVM